jgi:diadenosine tetraphosphate (Ap4A) HIT family hydrolase
MCDLCEQPGGEVVYRDDRLRVVLVDEPNFPGFCRVIWTAHVREMTDLSAEDRAHCMDVVWQVEAALRHVMQPHKINVASLGNVVPHVHWHVIPRFEDDTHFPAPVWAEAKRAADAASLDTRRAQLGLLRTAIVVELKSKKQSPVDGTA